jgi:signal transduction histidine kinase/DNA-binding response OmpR family regulator
MMASTDGGPHGSHVSGASFLMGGGETGALMRSMDWRQTRLGPASEWPQSLRTTLGICLSSRFPIAIYWGPEFVMLYNDSLLPMVGANKHPQAMGKPAFEVLPEIRQIIEPLLVHVRETGEATWSEDLMLPLVRGEAAEEGYFTFTYSPIHDESGGIGGVLCAVLETTEKVIEDRRLRLLSALADATQARTKEDACAHAAAQIARFGNDVPFALLYLLDEGARVARLAGAANVEKGTLRSPLSISLGGDSPWPFEMHGTPTAHDGQGGPRFVDLDEEVAGARSAVVLPIERSGGGRPLGFFVAGLSPLLRRGSVSYGRFHNLLAASLSQAVSNAAAYEQERKRAESLAELDRAKTTFFSNVSHEFRTPLTLMLAPIQDLLASPQDAVVDRQAVELLHRNALRLLKLVNTLLEFSRIEAGRIEAVYQPVDLSALTADLASTFRAAIERAGLALTVDCPALPEPIFVDEDMWEKIVVNLLSNAFKFTFAGSIRVSLQMEDDGAILQVADTGTGIPEHELPRLFERFHRIEGARSRSYEGSGIGLALIQELVRLHGGDIGVTSRFGTGTTFRVRIPRGSAHLDPARLRAKPTRPSSVIGVRAFVEEASRWVDPAPDAPEPAARLAERTDARERILFADDNADMREYVARILRERWTVEAVGDGAAARESMRRAPPALVLCDVMMPRLDGVSLVKAIRAEAAFEATPIIMLSARAGGEEAAKALDTGANDYIAKPFSARELVVRVASTLAGARATREMAALEERQRANLYRHFMQAPFPVAVLKGPSHVIDLANPEILRAWGKEPEIIGRTFAAALPELEGQPFLGYLDEVFRTGVAYEGRYEKVRLPTGAGGAMEARYYNFVYAPLRDTSRAIEGILVAAFDVSEQVRANLAKDEFLATMSHELRTPLNAIVGWSHLLRVGNVSPEQTPKVLATIERNAQMQSRLIEDILDLARIEQGKLVLSVASVEMVRVVEAALDVVRPAAAAKGIRLQPVLDSQATIVGDADRLQQVVWNLMSNAIKFTPKGGRVKVCLRRQESRVELVVADDGQGIAPGFLPHVFDRFRQAEASPSRAAGGLGLGLVIVRSIVELHGGTVTAESDGPGKGATFVVALPIATLRADSSTPRPAHDLGGRSLALEPSPALAGLRVVVVDDESEGRDLLQYVLEQCGSEVTVAGDAEEALATVSGGTFDVLISDIGMPKRDGYALIAAVRALPPAKGGLIPAVALTAYASAEDRTRALRAGFDMHLPKPVQPGELVAIVGRLVEGVRRRSAPVHLSA